MPFVLSAEELSSHTPGVGAKALNLLVLRDLGCRVPDFVAVPAAVLSRLSSAVLEEIVSETLSRLSSGFFAVRSAALIEDAAEQSYAGRFLTRIAVKPDELIQAIGEVADQARGLLGPELSNFSVIIQDYVEADLSGVTFTRQPSGERQMLIEYHRGRGEALVSGHIQPESFEWFWTEAPSVCPSELEQVLPFFRAIEQAFDHPQDIEWCIKDNVCFFLQARPITTISPQTYRGLQYLDRTLPHGRLFVYEQTEVSEIAPRPTPFTFSLLQRIYAPDGPVDRVYRRHGVRYQAGDFLRLVGNQLYVDREAELKTLLPAYSYFGHGTLEPKRTSCQGWWTSLRNQLALSRMAIPDIRTRTADLERALADIPFDKPYEEFWPAFDQAYALIFDTNLAAGTTLQQADAVLKPLKRNMTELLSASLRTTFFDLPAPCDIPDWVGNGLDLLDEGPFHASTPVYRAQPELDRWWQELPDWRQRFLRPVLTRALAYDALRERGRWLTVGYMNAFRRALGTRSIFLRLEELDSGSGLGRAICERERVYTEQCQFAFPARLTNVQCAARRQDPIGVSSGLAEGRLIDVATLAQETMSAEHGWILYAPAATPDLVRFFSRLSGLVCAQGGVLSHLAILAREHGMPMLTNVDLATHDVHIGDDVRIDATRATIKLR